MGKKLGLAISRSEELHQCKWIFEITICRIEPEIPEVEF